MFICDYKQGLLKSELREKSDGLTNNNLVNVPRLDPKDTKNYKVIPYN